MSLLKKIVKGVGSTVLRVGGTIAGSILPGAAGKAVQNVASAFADKISPAKTAPISTVSSKLTPGVGIMAAPATQAAPAQKVSAIPVQINPSATKVQQAVFGAPPKPVTVSSAMDYRTPGLVNMGVDSNIDPAQDKKKNMVVWLVGGALAFATLLLALFSGRKRKR